MQISARRFYNIYIYLDIIIFPYNCRPMSLYSQDLTQEGILQKYLDQKYTQAGLSFTRVKDKNLQHKGIDVIMKGSSQSVNVDEKAQLHYINQSLPTFAMEISYLKAGRLREGWLYDKNKATEAYALVFDIKLTSNVSRLARMEDISSCEVMLLYRNKLLDALSNNGLTREYCMGKSEELRQGRGNKKIIFDSNFNFQISSHLEEAPVNLIIRKTLLRTICARVI
jgi:hypothetical protein